MPMVRPDHMLPIIVNEQAGIHETINTRLSRRVQVVRVVTSAAVLPHRRDDPNRLIKRLPTRRHSTRSSLTPRLDTIGFHHPVQALVTIQPIVGFRDEEGEKRCAVF